MAEGTGTSNPGGFLHHIKVWAEGGSSCAGLCTLAILGMILLCPLDPRAPPLPDPPGVPRMWDVEEETQYFFSQTTTPSLDLWMSWVSLCPPGCGGTVSAREQPPSQLGPSPQGPGSGIWDGVGTGAGPPEGEKGAQELKHTTLTPEMDGGCFSLIYCHWLGAAVVAKGSWAVQHHTQENSMKSTKIRKPIYNIIAVNC